jgi:hypothetical protein
MHVLYNPVTLDFVRVNGKPVTCEKLGEVRTPPGHYWMMVVDEDDSTVHQPNGPAVKRGEPEIVMRGMHAVRLHPLVGK